MFGFFKKKEEKLLDKEVVTSIKVVFYKEIIKSFKEKKDKLVAIRKASEKSDKGPKMHHLIIIPIDDNFVNLGKKFLEEVALDSLTVAIQDFSKEIGGEDKVWDGVRLELEYKHQPYITVQYGEIT